MIEQKVLEIRGASIVVCGRSSDPYFANLNLATIANDALYVAVQDRIKPGSVILDIGANIGVTSSMFSKMIPRARIYAFEPGTQTYGLLLETLRANCVAAQTFNFGLGREHAAVSFNEPQMLAAGHIVTSDHPNSSGASTSRIEIKPLDSVVQELGLDRLDFMKIDVEGFEIDVLDGASETLSRFRPTVFLEFNSYCLIAFRNMNPRAALENLRAYFTRVFWRKDQQWHEISSPADEHEFIYANLVLHGCVTDLLCDFGSE